MPVSNTPVGDKTNNGRGVPISGVFWLANGERGVSSNTLFQHLSGIPCLEEHLTPCHPCDLADFRRCELLLRRVPEFRDHLYLMAEVSREWARLVERWDEIVALLSEEMPEWETKPRGKAERAAAVMREILD